MKLLKGEEGSRTDAIMLDIELDRAQVAWENAETSLEANKRQLVAAVGIPSLNLPHLAGQLEAELPKYDLIAVQRGVISRNSLVQIARMEVNRNEVLLRRAEVEPFPNINFQGGYQQQQPARSLRKTKDCIRSLSPFLSGTEIRAIFVQPRRISVHRWRVSAASKTSWPMTRLRPLVVFWFLSNKLIVMRSRCCPRPARPFGWCNNSMPPA